MSMLLRSAMRGTFCLLVLLGGLCLPSHATELIDRIVAIVNDDILTQRELDASLKPYVERIKALNYPLETEQEMLARVRSDLLNKLIDDKLTAQEIERFNISVEDGEVDRTLERIKDLRFLSDEEFEAALAQDGLTIDEYRKQVREQILRTKLVNVKIKSKIVITKDDIQAYYDDHQDLYRGETRYHLRNIVMRVPPLASESQKKSVHAKMQSILQELRNGRSFEEMARTYSQSSLAAEGGDLGFFRLEDLSRQLRKHLQDIQAGEFTPVLDTDQGYQIFYVEEIKETPSRTVEQTKGEIEEKLFNEIVDQKFRSWLQELRKQSHIKILDERASN